MKTADVNNFNLVESWEQLCTVFLWFRDFGVWQHVYLYTYVFHMLFLCCFSAHLFSQTGFHFNFITFSVLKMPVLFLLRAGKDVDLGEWENLGGVRGVGTIVYIHCMLTKNYFHLKRFNHSLKIASVSHTGFVLLTH